MARYTVTPWRHPSDLLTVRSQLYPSTPDDIDRTSQRHAVNRITAWKLRGNLPHAIDSTALLTDAQLHHHHQQTTPTDSNANSDFSLRAVYSAAFTRFVTGFCDIGRAREGRLGMEQSSMVAIARQIGMPLDFVALRHEATHEELPPLHRLVRATRQALGWLWEVYWCRLEDVGARKEDGGGVGLEEGMVEGRRMFKNFRAMRREAFRAGQHLSSKHLAEVAGVADECAQLDGHAQATAKALAAVLVGDELIMPSNRVLGQSIHGAFVMWDILLRELSNRLTAFPAALVDALLLGLVEKDSLNDSQQPASEAMYLWLDHLLAGIDNGTGVLPGDMVQPLHIQAIRTCCLHSGYWTQRLGKQLVDSDPGLQEDWHELFEASIVHTDVEMADDHDVAIPGAVADPSSSDALPQPLTNREHAASASVGWRRAAFSPSAPIGIVA
ncbi:hypothetical protein LTR62_000080 [Meristemomyces frigidus]|uniref:Las1-domain-containing protein n=1 Tax=Meristemomyces frigidus TaxID=1508187 RepID=A0AAN7YUL9_9PEZI|nr:hypothetical protein LTR62_000080 [Meristemomyces frigidus]